MTSTGDFSEEAKIYVDPIKTFSFDFLCKYQTKYYNKETEKSYIYTGVFATFNNFIYDYESFEFSEYSYIGIEYRFKEEYIVQFDVLPHQDDIIHADFEVHNGESISYYLLNIYTGISEHIRDKFFN